MCWAAKTPCSYYKKIKVRFLGLKLHIDDYNILLKILMIFISIIDRK